VRAGPHLLGSRSRVCFIINQPPERSPTKATIRFYQRSACTMMLVQTKVQNSHIEGVGIFAAQFIRKGQEIWRLDERFDLVYPEKTVASFPPDMQDYFNRYGYPHMTRSGFIVLEIDNGRFMNHSEEPNTNFTDSELGWAIRDIQIGEELLCDYSEFDRTFTGFTGALVARTPVLEDQMASKR
jgi:uncharacterized protein